MGPRCGQARAPSTDGPRHRGTSQRPIPGRRIATEWRGLVFTPGPAPGSIKARLRRRDPEQSPTPEESSRRRLDLRAVQPHLRGRQNGERQRPPEHAEVNLAKSVEHQANGRGAAGHGRQGKEQLKMVTILPRSKRMGQEEATKTRRGTRQEVEGRGRDHGAEKEISGAKSVSTIAGTQFHSRSSRLQEHDAQVPTK